MLALVKDVADHQRCESAFREGKKLDRPQFDLSGTGTNAQLELRRDR
jgi:hypothetical protein